MSWRDPHTFSPEHRFGLITSIFKGGRCHATLNTPQEDTSRLSHNKRPKQFRNNIKSPTVLHVSFMSLSEQLKSLSPKVTCLHQQCYWLSSCIIAVRYLYDGSGLVLVYPESLRRTGSIDWPWPSSLHQNTYHEAPIQHIRAWNQKSGRIWKLKGTIRSDYTNIYSARVVLRRRASACQPYINSVNLTERESWKH